MSVETKKAQSDIDALVELAKKSLERAAELADEHGLSFKFEGPEGSYGMGGMYRHAVTDWEPSTSCEYQESSQNHEGEWVSSNQEC